MARVVSEKRSVSGYKVPITRVAMGRDRQGRTAKWTSRKVEEQIACQISDGLRCAHCTKEFTFEEEEDFVVPKPEHYSVSYHKECWEKIPKGELPDWSGTKGMGRLNKIIPTGDGNRVLVISSDGAKETLEKR